MLSYFKTLNFMIFQSEEKSMFGFGYDRENIH